MMNSSTSDTNSDAFYQSLLVASYSNIYGSKRNDRHEYRVQENKQFNTTLLLCIHSLQASAYVTVLYISSVTCKPRLYLLFWQVLSNFSFINHFTTLLLLPLYSLNPLSLHVASTDQDALQSSQAKVIMALRGELLIT